MTQALTVRGRCFLAAGLATVVSAFVLGQRDLLRVGLFVTVLPLLALLAVHRSRYRLSCARRLEPSRVPAGSSAQVVLRIDNVSRLQTGVLLAEDTIPAELGGRPRFVLDRLPARGAGEVAYPLRADVRGHFPVGPLTVRLADPFGLCELTRAFTSTDSLVVTPRTVALPATRLGGEWAVGGDSRARAMASVGDEDAATREYRHGDDLRRVHWRSTARYGELMVRREEQPWQSRAAVLLDTRAAAHLGRGPDSSFEWAVEAAASVSVALVRAGYALTLVEDTGAAVDTAGALGATVAVTTVLDALAVASLGPGASLLPGAERLQRGGGHGLVVAVLGTLTPAEAEALARMRHGTTGGIAVLLDTPTWPALGGAAGGATAAATGSGANGSGAYGSGTPRPAPAGRVHTGAGAAMLRSAGWRVLPAAAGDSLAALWPLAGVGAGRSPAGRLEEVAG